ncbi:MAG: hypothetical protein OXE79_05635 [Acidimicrobiaceae bacterium]|nr:hypothetical protein [Acidimicrobiaceae bacterium]MCY4280202.1 hypothetical protein [Acidimicrobiaceae bacterium]MCY4293616.1 hypothetical protein [Acidimicrobiaceae bacterium]
MRNRSREVGAAPGLADPARELLYRLYATCEKRGWTDEALAYNDQVQSCPTMSLLAALPPQSQEALHLKC